jgi:ATP-dependent DNA ligase
MRSSAIGFSVAPQLARLADEIPTGDAWTFEPKLDGLRGICSSGGPVAVQSRNGKALDRWFPEIVEAARGLPPGTVVDGELVATANGAVSFDAVAGRLSGRRTPGASLVVFDLLALGGEDLRHLPFADRRRSLEALRLALPMTTVVQTHDRDVAAEWLGQAWSLGLEGVVAKARALPYRPGERMWLKIKAFENLDVVVGGHTGPPGDPHALLLGAFDGSGRLHAVGSTSSLADPARRALNRALPQLHADHSFTGIQPGQTRWERGRDVVWTPLRPCLVCEVSASRIDGFQMRHAARFVRWRPDKVSAECTTAAIAAVAVSRGATAGA